MKNVLIIEDDKLISSLVQFKLRKEGYNVTMAEDGISGIDAINLLEADLIITDVMIPFKNGIEIINHARKVSLKFRLLYSVLWEKKALSWKLSILEYLILFQNHSIRMNLPCRLED